MMSRVNNIPYRLGRRPGQEGPLQEVRGTPTVVMASAYNEDYSENTCSSGSACQSESSISRCGRKRYMTCPALDSNNSFTSSISGKTYKVLGTQAMSCNTTSVVYLITCKRCGIQYVGETGQELRRRMNNHRNRIKSLQPQPLYKHFNSDGHSLDDLTIQPIEEVVLEPGENMSIHSKRLVREDFWMRELKTIQPYGLNDNVKGVGNKSKHYVEPVVWSFFWRCLRRRKRGPNHLVSTLMIG